MTRILILADRHHYHGEDETSPYKLVKKFAKDFKPDLTVDLGDLLDLPYLARFNESNLKVLSEGVFRKDFDLVNKELDFWQAVSGGYVQIEGNHDERILRLTQKEPMWDGMINYESEHSLKLKERGIPYIHQADEPFRKGKLTFVHGYSATKYSSAVHLDMYGHNVVFGHVHKFQMFSKILHIAKEEIQGWAIGCLGVIQPEWLKGKPSHWQFGFGVCYMDEKSGRFNLYPVNIINNEFFFEGRKWRL